MQESLTNPLADQTPDNPLILATRDGYDLWSAIYDVEDNPLIILEERVALPLLGDVRGLRIADVGCGTGRHALRMAAQGADVAALDFSNGMLDAARTKPGAGHIRWIEHDLTRALPLPDGAMNRVVCALVFDHVSDVRGLMSELRRICASDGFILITIMHPAMMLRGVQARFHDPETGRTTMPASVPNLLSDYVMGALHAGLRIEYLSEHAVDAELVRVSPRAEKYLGWPLLVVMKLLPVG